MNTILRVFTEIPPNKDRKANFQLPCEIRQMEQRWKTTRMYFYRNDKQTMLPIQVPDAATSCVEKTN